MGRTDLEALFSRVEREALAPRKLPAKLKRLPTTSRQAILILAVVASVLVAVFISGARPDAALLPATKMALYLGSMGLLISLSLTLALRPLHMPAPSRARTLGMVLLSVLGMGIWAWMPDGHAVASQGASFPCLLHGILFGLPVYVVARMLDRGGVFFTMIFAAAAAGLTAHVALQATCPITTSEHVLLGHSGAGASFLAAVALVAIATRRAQRTVK